LFGHGFFSAVELLFASPGGGLWFSVVELVLLFICISSGLLGPLEGEDLPLAPFSPIADGFPFFFPFPFSAAPV
jgi:hypothetical protein